MVEKLVHVSVDALVVVWVVYSAERLGLLMVDPLVVYGMI